MERPQRCGQEFLLGHPRIKGSMRLPVAYRSLARPSSVLEPSHSPDGIATPKTFFPDKQNPHSPLLIAFAYLLRLEFGLKGSCPASIPYTHTNTIFIAHRLGCALFCFVLFCVGWHHIPIQRPKTKHLHGLVPRTPAKGGSQPFPINITR